jgi:hypothetical protein
MVCLDPTTTSKSRSSGSPGSLSGAHLCCVLVLHNSANLSIMVCSNPGLEFVASPALAPPEVQVDAKLMEDYERQLAAAASNPLPEEEDADL